MTEPTDVLRDEHVLILRAVDVLATAAGRTRAGGDVDGAWWARLIAWLRAFADRNHHVKEERLPFPAMERAGVPVDGGPIGVMLEEHAEGRALIQAMEASTGAARAEHADRYVGLLQAHIDKENSLLFPLADAVLGDDVRAALGRDFAAVADELGRDAWLAHASLDLTALARELPSGPEQVDLMAEAPRVPVK